MFDGFSHWTWVTIAWLQVVVAYLGYLVYLGRRRRRLLEDDRARRLVQEEAAAPGVGAVTTPGEGGGR